ncbi:MAG TPA: VWA domain-containing protein [Polyangia bacterium]|jgi:hypothetical protein
MRFLAPSLLLGLLAAFLPWYVHRLGRRRANPLPFAAIQLLLRAEREVAARRRLRDVLLLIVRTAVAAALPLLFARPFTEVRSDLPASTGRPQTAVVILDDSASLQRRTGPLTGSTLFEAARGRTRALLENMAPESDVALLLGCEGSPSPVAEPSSDRSRLLAALDAVKVSARRADLSAALGRAAQVARAGAHGERHIYLVTDLQASGFASEATPAPADVSVTVVPVGATEQWDNRAITDLTATPAPDLGAQGLAVVAEIANFSARPASHLAVALRVDGDEVGRGFVDIAPGARIHKRFLHSFPLGGTAGAAAHEIEVALEPDRFPLDDTRRTRVEISRGLRILVVDGDPRTVRNEDEVFFLEAALRAGGSHFQVQVALPDELAARNLGDYAAVFLANVARPNDAAAAALVRYVEGGGGVFISVGDKVDADVWNQRLHKILPQPLGLRRTAAARPGTQDGETVDTRPAERLGPIDRRHPLLAGFTAGGEGLASARFFQYELLEPSPSDGTRHVILRYETGAPALVEAEIGAGRVLLLTTTVDREWTDLPIRPGFLPLIQEAARRLAGAPSGDAIGTLIIGASREIRCAAEDRRIEITKPSGDVRALIPDAPSDPGAKPPGGGSRASRVVVFRDTDQVGTYRVRAYRNNGAWVDRPGEAFIANLDVRESDPAILLDAQRPDRQGPGNAAVGNAPLRHLELWHVLGGALIAFLLLESILTARFRREPPPRAVGLPPDVLATKAA